jgi:WD40 repeat protein
MLVMKTLTVFLQVVLSLGCSPLGSVAKGDKKTTRPPHPDRQIIIADAAISAEGKLLLSQQAVNFSSGGPAPEPANFKRLRLWDLDTGREIRAFEGQLSPVAFLPDDRHALISNDPSVTVDIWDVVKGKKVRNLGGKYLVSPKLLLSADGKVAIELKCPEAEPKSCFFRLWDVPGSKLVRNFDGPFLPTPGFVLSAEGKWALSFHSEQKGEATVFSVKTWDVSSGKATRSFDLPQVSDGSWGGPMAISPDGKTAILLCQQNSPTPQKNFVTVWDLATDREVQRFPIRLLPSGICFTGDGKHVLTANKNGVLQLWDLASGKEIWSVTKWMVSPDRFLLNAKLALSDKAMDPKFWEQLNEKVACVVNHISEEALPPR